MGRLIMLTAAKQNGQSYSNPRVVYLNEENIQVIPANTSTGKTKVIEQLGNTKTVYEVYEKATQIEIARNPASTDLYLKKLVYSALTGAGTTQGAGTALNSLGYFFETLTIGAAATEAFTLPSATVGKVVVIVNNDVSGDAAKVFPASGQYHKGQAVNTVLSIASGARKHLVCLTAGIWTLAEDFGI